MNNVMTEEHGRSAFDMSDVPTPEDIAQGQTQKCRAEASAVLDTIRVALRAGETSPRLPDGISQGALKLINDALRPRGWCVRSSTDQRDPGYYLRPL